MARRISELRKSIAVDVLACAALVALVWILYRKVLRLWWMYDDPYLLNVLKHATAWSLLRTGGLETSGSPLFNPLLMFSLKLDLAAFGQEAISFYAHHLIAFSLLVVLEYVLLRLWCSPLPSFAAVLVMMTGAPLLQIVPLLMERHYIEGAVFAVASMILYVVALRRDQPLLAIGSGAAYFLAACSKEIYVPLPALLAVLPERNPRRRLEFLVSHVIAAVGYAAWRLAAIGFDVAPYGNVAPEGKRALLLATLPLRLVRELAGAGSAAGWTLVTVIIISAAAVIIRIPKSRLPAIVGIVIAVLPLVPVSAGMDRRWAFALWLLASSAIAFLPRVFGRWGIALAAICILASLAAFRTDWPDDYRNLMRMSDEARVLALLGPDDVVRNCLTPPDTMLQLQRLTGTQARAFYDDLPFCNPVAHFERIFEYEPRRREVLEIGNPAVRRSCASIVTKPLRVRISLDATGTLVWHLGPYTDGSWMFILADGVVAYTVPRDGTFRRTDFRHLKLRVRYLSPAGWRTYSPLLPVDADHVLIHTQ